MTFAYELSRRRVEAGICFSRSRHSVSTNVLSATKARIGFWADTQKRSGIVQNLSGHFKNITSHMVIGYRLYNEAASKKQVSAAAKDLLLRLVKKYWPATEPQRISIENSDSGAPLLNVNGYPVYCSLSHKSGCIAAAYSTTSTIGIDLENVHTRKDYHRIRDYYKDGFLAGSTLTKSDFFHHWTLAEAFAKASGVPLLSVLEMPLHRQKHSAKYFQIEPFLLCAYQSDSSEREDAVLLYQLDNDNQWQ